MTEKKKELMLEVEGRITGALLRPSTDIMKPDGTLLAQKSRDELQTMKKSFFNHLSKFNEKTGIRKQLLEPLQKIERKDIASALHRTYEISAETGSTMLDGAKWTGRNILIPGAKIAKAVGKEVLVPSAKWFDRNVVERILAYPPINDVGAGLGASELGGGVIWATCYFIKSQSSQIIQSIGDGSQPAAQLGRGVIQYISNGTPPLTLDYLSLLEFTFTVVIPIAAGAITLDNS